MLKVKNSIDLKELENFGFIKNTHKDIDYYWNDILYIDGKDRIIKTATYNEIYGEFDDMDYDMDILFDIIQAGFIEKVKL